MRVGKADLAHPVPSRLRHLQHPDELALEGLAVAEEPLVAAAAPWGGRGERGGQGGRGGRDGRGATTKYC